MFFFRSDKAMTRRGYFAFDAKRSQLLKTYGRLLDYNDMTAVSNLYK